MSAAVLGVLLALGLPPFSLGALVPVVLAVALRRPRGFGFGFLLGLGFWAVHIGWLPASFAAWFGPFGVVPFLFLVVFLALLWGLLFGLFGRAPLALAGAWVGLEWLLAQGPLSFPWGYLGYALVPAGGRVLAAAVGVWGLSLLVLVTAVLLARGRRWPLLFWGLLWLWPLPPANPRAEALLVQAAINPLAKFRGAEAAARYLALTRLGLRRHPGVRLVVWPETAVPMLPREVGSVLGGRPLIYGTWGPGPRNEVRLWQGGRDRAVYAKQRLVPFGEFFPGRRLLAPVYAFFFRKLGVGFLSDLKPGHRNALLGDAAAFVCYEADYPDRVRELVLRGAGVLVNVSNDAWFGVGYGRAQHLAMARMRAVEEGRWLLRAANDGISASIDPYGRVVARSTVGRAEALLAPYAVRRRLTPYARYGDLPVLGAAWTLVLIGLLETAPRRSQ